MKTRLTGKEEVYDPKIIKIKIIIVNDDRCHVNKGVIANNHPLYSIVKPRYHFMLRILVFIFPGFYSNRIKIIVAFYSNRKKG